MDGNDTLRGLKLSLLEDSYFDQKGYDAYEQMEAIDTANAIKKLSALEKYYKKYQTNTQSLISTTTGSAEYLTIIHLWV